MLKFIYEKIFGTKSSKIKLQIEKKYLQAIEFQRNGKIREYSQVMEEIEKMEKEYERLQSI